MTGDVIHLDGGLFEEPERVVPPPDKRTVGQRRRDRQEVAVTRGQHPLSVALKAPLPLHPDVRTQNRGTQVVGGPTCGGCALRRRLPGGNRDYPKCTAHPQPRSRTAPDGKVWRWDEYPRASHGEGTDVHRSWPACIDYQPKEQ